GLCQPASARVPGCRVTPGGPTLRQPGRRTPPAPQATRVRRDDPGRSRNGASHRTGSETVGPGPRSPARERRLLGLGGGRATGGPSAVQPRLRSAARRPAILPLAGAGHGAAPPAGSRARDVAEVRGVDREDARPVAGTARGPRPRPRPRTDGPSRP